RRWLTDDFWLSPDGGRVTDCAVAGGAVARTRARADTTDGMRFDMDGDLPSDGSASGEVRATGVPGCPFRNHGRLNRRSGSGRRPEQGRRLKGPWWPGGSERRSVEGGGPPSAVGSRRSSRP